MHLSMSSPKWGEAATHGILTVAYIPRVGILIGHNEILYYVNSRRHVDSEILGDTRSLTASRCHINASHMRHVDSESTCLLEFT